MGLRVNPLGFLALGAITALRVTNLTDLARKCRVTKGGAGQRDVQRIADGKLPDAYGSSSSISGISSHPVPPEPFL